jgi:hypothetical protein
MDKNLTSEPHEAELARRRALRDRHAHDLVELVTRRRELIGVNPWADQVIEGVAWTA